MTTCRVVSGVTKGLPSRSPPIQAPAAGAAVDGARVVNRGAQQGIPLGPAPGPLGAASTTGDQSSAGGASSASSWGAPPARPPRPRTKGEELGVQRQHRLPDVLERGVDAAQEDGQARVDCLVKVGEPLARLVLGGGLAPPDLVGAPRALDLAAGGGKGGGRRGASRGTGGACLHWPAACCPAAVMAVPLVDASSSNEPSLSTEQNTCVQAAARAVQRLLA